MGQWATRRRRGGGPLTLNYITRAQKAGGIQILLTYANDVSAAAVQSEQFESTPSGQTQVTVDQPTIRTLSLNMNGDVSADTTVTYSGTVQGFLTPQSINYS
jgi:hypothetical protein